MFTKFHIKNFRTHVDTEINLKDLTLIIGSNNSGKTNLLEAISFFAELVTRGSSENLNKTLLGKDYLNNKHTSSTFKTPIFLSCEWSYSQNLRLVYSVAIKIDTNLLKASCEERLTVFTNNGQEIDTKNYKHLGEHLLLQEKLLTKNTDYTATITQFFQELANCNYYHLQPVFLKGEAVESISFDHKNIRYGTDLLNMLKNIKNEQHEKYNKFVSIMQRFESSFVGLSIENDEILWQFDVGNDIFPSFPAKNVSEGVLIASVVALFFVLPIKSKLIMLEEIENGINQTNIREILEWLRGASNAGKNMQFILTTHSPSVIREFADRTDCVYNVHLRKKKGYISEVSNLSDALKTLIKFGAIKEETVVEDEGVVKIRPYALTEMFYNGVLGSL